MFIKVQFPGKDGEWSREFSYRCPFKEAKVGWNARVPSGDRTSVGRISQVNVPEEELGCPQYMLREVLSVSQNVKEIVPAAPTGQISLDDLEVPEDKPQESLIVIRQLPIIEERLQSMKAEIETAVKNALSLAVTEDTVKEVKKVRADLNARYKELEKQRIAVKTAILEPYHDFEQTYADCVTNVFTPADKQLKEKIDSVEDGIKARKMEAVRKYFEEYRASIGLDPELADFSAFGVKPTLSTTEKWLRTQAQQFLDIMKQDVTAIGGMENADEILAEYRKTRRLSEAVATVNDRHARIAEEKKRRELMEQEEARIREETARAEALVAEAIQEHPPVPETPPVAVSEAVAANAETTAPELPFVEFRVYGTIEQLRALKIFMNDGGYQYVSI